MSFQQFSPLNDAQNEKPSASYNEMAGDPRNQLRDQESESVPVRTPVALMGPSGKSRDPTSGILHIVKDP